MSGCRSLVVMLSGSGPGQGMPVIQLGGGSQLVDAALESRAVDSCLALRTDIYKFILSHSSLAERGPPGNRRRHLACPHIPKQPAHLTAVSHGSDTTGSAGTSPPAPKVTSRPPRITDQAGPRSRGAATRRAGPPPTST
jgi:hypothetical protein